MQRADAVHYLPGKTCYLLLLLVAFVKQLELVESGGDRGPFNLLGWICLVTLFGLHSHPAEM